MSATLIEVGDTVRGTLFHLKRAEERAAICGKVPAAGAGWATMRSHVVVRGLARVAVLKPCPKCQRLAQASEVV